VATRDSRLRGNELSAHATVTGEVLLFDTSEPDLLSGEWIFVHIIQWDSGETSAANSEAPREEATLGEKSRNCSVLIHGSAQSSTQSLVNLTSLEYNPLICNYLCNLLGRWQPACPKPARHCIWSMRRVSRILVVDDDPESRDLLSEVLETNGYPQVEAVADGLAAREALARDNDCPIIIADLHMPNESGLDLLRHLRKQKAKHEIVLMSSFFSLAERKLARDLGAYALLDKPFRISELLELVSQLAGRNSIGISN